MMNDVLQLLENLGIDAPAIQLWIFPEEDFAAYRELYGEEACDTYKEYVNDKMEMARHMGEQGLQTTIVRFPVAYMEEALAKKNLENSPENRACIIGEYKAEGVSSHLGSLEVGGGKTDPNGAIPDNA